MQRTGRIGRDILDIDGSAFTDHGTPQPAPARSRSAAAGEPECMRKAQIDEAGAGDATSTYHHQRSGAALRQQSSATGAAAPGRFGENHRDIGGDVAMLRLARRL